MQEYSEDEVKDITERDKKCLDFLKENQMTPAASMQKVNIGNDVFADKLIPFLSDFKYNKNPMVSPIQGKDIKPKDEPNNPSA